MGVNLHLETKSHRPFFEISGFFSVCMWYCKGIWPASGQQNLGNSATKALSSYFGNWLASQSPNLTWPLGLAFLTNLKTISKWHLHICFSACSSPCTMHMNNGCKPTPQNKKSQTQISIFLSFSVCMWYLKGIWPASGQQKLGNSATKALSSYFGNWLASQSPNLTWPLGLALLTIPITVSIWQPTDLLACMPLTIQNHQ